jgi:hypothetical protein
LLGKIIDSFLDVNFDSVNKFISYVFQMMGCYKVTTE